MIVPVSGVGLVGLAPDMPAHEMPLNAWTSGQNVRFRNGAVEKFSGHLEIYPTPTVSPYWLLPVNTETTFFWLYGGLLKVGATDGNTHADITRAAGGDYTVDLNVGWTGTVLGKIPVISNGFDVPQMWNTPALGTRLTALSNWPASTSCRAMRSLKRYLVALDITKTGTRYPYLIKWSDKAPPGGVPLSWDETDETVDAAEFELPADGGHVIDAAPLRDSLMVYKEYESWLMEFIGGIDIFNLRRKFSEFGMLSRRCAVQFFNGKHLVYTGEDVVLHDSQQAKSLMDARSKKLLTELVDSSFFARSFVSVNYLDKEVWVCVPGKGQSIPTLALVWNWVFDTWGVRELPSTAFISSGVVNPIDASELWSGATGDWDTETLAWGDRSFDPNQRKMLMAVPGITKLLLPNTTNQFSGVNMTAFVERQSLGFPLKMDGPPDFTTEKMFKGLWPRIEGQVGDIVNVYVGTQQKISGPVVWSTALPFTIGSSEFIDYIVSAPLFALRFESAADVSWKLSAYDVDVVPIGRQH